MAAARNTGGQHSPTTNTRNERVFEDAQFTGVINLSGKKLKDFPHCAKKYDLSDTVVTDLSKNRYAELPDEVCKYESLEQLNLYHNVIKALPTALSQLHALVNLNLGRNQLTVLPPFLCTLPCLEVLQVSNNKLVSLPEEIGGLERLMELDVSCNEITQLPTQIGDLKALKQLNVRRNLLVELPNSLSRLRLHGLDFSSNKISEIPCDVHSMETLQELHLEHNPLTCPPAHLCTKGLVHIKKYLFIQALKEDRKRGLLSDVQLRKNFRKSGIGQNFRKAEEYRYSGSPRDRRKRHTVDSGYSTTDSSEKMRWSPSEELQRQKSEYEARKRRAEQLRLERERQEEEMRERDDRRRTTLKIQEEETDGQVEEGHHDISSGTGSMANSLSSTSLGTLSTTSEPPESSHIPRGSRVPQSNSFREEKKPTHHLPYRRTVSDTNYNVRYPYNHVGLSAPMSNHLEQSPSSEGEELTQAKNGHVNHTPQESSPQTADSNSKPEPPRVPDQPRVHYIPVIHDTSSSSPSTQEDEFRRRHESMLNHQRHEAQMIQRRLEEKKQHILRMQKELVIKWSAGPADPPKMDGGGDYHVGAPNSSFSSPLANNKSGLPPRCQKVLEALGPELNNANPSFTIRRNIQQAQDEIDLIEKLRKTIESRLKVTLPENLPAALKDGVVLCHLANHIRPRSVSSIHVPSPAVPKLPLSRCRRNVENFLEACRRIGVEQEELFTPLDILEERGIINVAYAIQVLVGKVSDTKQSAV